MGNSQISEQKDAKTITYTWDTFERTHKKLKTYDDDRYGTITIYQEMVMPSNEEFNKPVLKFVKEFWSLSNQSEVDTEAIIHGLKINTCENLMPFIAHFEVIEQKFCSSFSKHLLVYEYLGETLKRSTERWALRRTPDGKRRVFIPEPQIWHIISSVHNSLETLNNEPLVTSHGDIQPRTIHLSNPEISQTTSASGKVLLYPSPYLSPNIRASAFQSPSPHCGYHKALTINYKSPLSPLLLNALKSKQVNPEHDPSSSDIFSLGVTLLSTCTNQPFEVFYDWNNLNFNYALKGNELARMRKIGYSNELVNIIDRMIEETELRRINLDGIGDVIDRIDKIGKVGDAFSIAASRSRRDDSVFDDLRVSRNDSVYKERKGGSTDKRTTTGRSPTFGKSDYKDIRGQSANNFRKNHSVADLNRKPLKPLQLSTIVNQEKKDQGSKTQSNNVSPLTNSYYIPTASKNQVSLSSRSINNQTNTIQSQNQCPIITQPNVSQNYRQQGPTPIVTQQHTQPKIHQRPEQIYSQGYRQQNQNVRHQHAIVIDGNKRMGTPPKFTTTRAERQSIGNYSSSKVKTSTFYEQEPTEVEIIEGIDKYGQQVKSRIYTSVNRTVFKEVIN